MQSINVKKTFQKYLKAAGLKFAKMTPTEGIDVMLSFYQNERADDCSLEHDQDMLLFQWGVYDSGSKEYFNLDITRQFMFFGFEDEDIWQLSFTFKFIPSKTQRDIKSGNRWCSSLGDIKKFHKFIQKSKAFQSAGLEKPDKVELKFDCAG